MTKSKFVNIRQPDGAFSKYIIPNDIISLAEKLPQNISRYFIENNKSSLFKVEELVLSRFRPEGVANAIVLMEEAYNGKRSKRAPISLTPIEEGKFLVNDGNSTTAIACAAGWSHIIGEIEGD